MYYVDVNHLKKETTSYRVGCDPTQSRMAFINTLCGSFFCFCEMIDASQCKSATLKTVVIDPVIDNRLCVVIDCALENVLVVVSHGIEQLNLKRISY